MTKEKSLELLENILLSTKSQDKVFAPTGMKHFYIGEKKYDTDNLSQFNYTLQQADVGYSFKVIVNKIPIFTNEFLWIKSKDVSRYVTTISVHYKASTYYSNSEKKDEFVYDSGTDASTLLKQKELYDFLMDKHLKHINKAENDKIETYLKEAKKLHSKDVVRDEKLDKLLS